MTVPSALDGRRIVFVTPRYPPYVGGTEVHTSEVARRLHDAGVDVAVLTSDTEARQPRTVDRDGVPVRLVPALPSGNDLYWAPRLRAELAGLGPNLVHVQGYHTLFGPLAMRAAAGLGIPHVVTFHSGGHSSRLRTALRPLHQRLLRPAFRRADALVAVSEFERRLFARRIGVSPSAIDLIPSGTELRSVPTRQAREDRTVITSLGRLERYKGHHQLIQALPELLATRPDVELRLIGTGSYETRLRKLVDRLGLDEHVSFRRLPSSSREDLAAELAEARLVALLSEYESQGLAAFEALAVDVPVLVLESTALAELAESGLAAAVPPRSTPATLARIIDEQLRAPVRSGSPRPPGWDRTVADLLALYGRVLDRTARTDGHGVPDVGS